MDENHCTYEPWVKMGKPAATGRYAIERRQSWKGIVGLGLVLGLIAIGNSIRRCRGEEFFGAHLSFFSKPS